MLRSAHHHLIQNQKSNEEVMNMVTVQNVLEKLPVTVVTGEAVQQPITGGYVSDLLSNVMGQAVAGNVWITMQGHQNVVAVALLSGLAAVIIVGGVQPDGATVTKARAEGLVLLTTELSAYEVVGQLYQLGIKG